MTLQFPRIGSAVALTLAVSAVTGCSSATEPSDEAFCTASDRLEDQMLLITMEVDGIDEIVTGATGDGSQDDLEALREHGENILALIEPVHGYSDTASANVTDPEVAKALDDSTFYALKIVTMMAEEGLDATSISDFLDGVASHTDLEEELEAVDWGAVTELIVDYREAKCDLPDAD